MKKNSVHNNKNGVKSQNGNTDSLTTRFKTNEDFFSSFIDLIPPKIYLNPDDHSYWTKLATNQSKKRKQHIAVPNMSKDENNKNGFNKNDEDDEKENTENEDDNEIAHTRFNKFDPRLFKSVSQILKDFERFEETNKNDMKKKFHFNKPLTNNNVEKNTSVKVFNKSQHKSLTKNQNPAATATGDSSKSTGENTDENSKSDEPTASNKASSNKRISKFKEQKNAALKHKRQRYDSQNEAQIVKMDHNDSPVNNNANKERKPILNKNGQVVFSKFDFTADKTINHKKNKEDKLTAINAKPKDYKKLLKKLQEKREKVEQLKQNEPEKANELEIKDKWRSAIDKASGLKVKDDVSILKKAVKRLEKKKEKSKKNWQERVKSVESKKNQIQDKRRKNIEKRREKNKETKIKKLKKKGRILPGF
jgi:hypothetical protein